MLSAKGCNSGQTNSESSNPGHPQIAVIQDASGRVLAADITALTEEGRKLAPLVPRGLGQCNGN